MANSMGSVMLNWSTLLTKQARKKGRRKLREEHRRRLEEEEKDRRIDEGKGGFCCYKGTISQVSLIRSRGNLRGLRRNAPICPDGAGGIGATEGEGAGGGSEAGGGSRRTKGIQGEGEQT